MNNQLDINKSTDNKSYVMYIIKLINQFVSLFTLPPTRMGVFPDPTPSYSDITNSGIKSKFEDPCENGGHIVIDEFFSVTPDQINFMKDFYESDECKIILKNWGESVFSTSSSDLKSSDPIRPPLIVEEPKKTAFVWAMLGGGEVCIRENETIEKTVYEAKWLLLQLKRRRPCNG